MLLCSAPFIGCMPSPVRVVDEQPLANAKANASPKQTLILARRLYFIFITGFSCVGLFFCYCEQWVRKFNSGNGSWSKRPRAFPGQRSGRKVEPVAPGGAQRIQLGESRRGETVVRRVKTHRWREDPITVFGLAFRFVPEHGKPWIARLKHRAEKIQRFKGGLDDNNRRDDLNRCHQGGATGVVAAVVRMRIVRGLLGIMHMACFTVRVFRNFGFLRVGMMIVAGQALNGAMRSRLQPKHDNARRQNAEADVKAGLPRNHISIHCPPSMSWRVGGRTPPFAALDAKARYFFSIPLVAPVPGVVAQQKAESSPHLLHV